VNQLGSRHQTVLSILTFFDRLSSMKQSQSMGSSRQQYVWPVTVQNVSLRARQEWNPAWVFTR